MQIMSITRTIPCLPDLFCVLCHGKIISRHLLRVKDKYWRLFSTIDLRTDFLLALTFTNRTIS